MSWLANKLEEWAFQETLRMNERGFPIDRQLVDKTIRFIESYTASQVTRCKELTGGIAPTEVKQLTAWLGLPNLQRVALERILKKGHKHEEVIRIRLDQGRVSTKKLYKMIEMDSGDHRMRGSFIYHGAGPGRWTAVRLQPHNFQRPTIEPEEVEKVISYLDTENYEALLRDYPTNVMEAVGSCMRGFFCAPPGMVMVRADYSAIEARVLAWLAGQDDLTLAFHENKDIYIVMASYIFGVPEATILAGHKAEDVVASGQRKLGKDTILGAGYSMWVKTFLLQMESKGSDKINGIPLRLNPRHIGSTEESHFNPEAWEMAKAALVTYRNRYPRITELWQDLDSAALMSVRSPGRKFRVRGKIIFYMVGTTLKMRLPSGRDICYPGAHIERIFKFNREIDQVVFRAVTDRGIVVDEEMYGGKWTENAVQGIARDLMCYGLYNSAKAGYENIGTVHDEIIALVDEKRSAGTDKHFAGIICQLPTWATGTDLKDRVPLAAAGVVSRRYGK